MRLAGETTKCWMFVMRLSASGQACHRLYANQAQEAFLDGHVEAFKKTFGGVVRRVRCDYVPRNIIRDDDREHAPEVLPGGLEAPYYLLRRLREAQVHITMAARTGREYQRVADPLSLPVAHEAHAAEVDL